MALASLAAQRPVLTVGGSSPDYADLPAAVAAAASGTIIEVRQGTYTGFATQKSLRVVLRDATVLAPAGADYAIEVSGVPGSDPFVIKGSNVSIAAGVLGSFRVSNTAAPIVIEGIRLIGSAFQSALDVFNAGSVHVARSELAGNPAMQVQFANLISNENLVGNTVGPAAILVDTLFDSARSIYLGTGQPALRLFDCDARLSSDGSGQMLVLGTPVVPVSAIEASDCTVYWDPSQFVLAPANGAPPLLAVLTTEVLEEVPMMISTRAVLGAPARVRMSVASPTVGMIAIGLLRPTPIQLGSTPIYPDLATTVLATAGVVDPNGLIVNFTVPTNPTLRGELFCFQGVTFSATGATAFSGPALWCLE